MRFRGRPVALPWPAGGTFFSSSGFYAQHPTERSNEGDAAPVDVRGPETLAGTRLVSGTFFYALQNGGGVNCGSYQNCGGKGENCRKQLQVSSVFNSLIRMAKERHFGQFSFASFDAPKPSVAFSALPAFLLPLGLSLFLLLFSLHSRPQTAAILYVAGFPLSLIGLIGFAVFLLAASNRSFENII